MTQALSPLDIIAKKRDGQALFETEIVRFVHAYAADDIPDYQAAAFLMAVFINGMTDSETIALTQAMAQSGEMLDLSDVTDYAVDKHSSGGVGDKTSLIVLPLVASCGVTVAKMSGRGLGLTGGTLDKLESIPGFRVSFSDAEFRTIARQTGLVLAGQTASLAPADGKFYALRDVTATVPSLPLIVASIMSKKIAAGANGIVLDVKTGAGAFMPTVEKATELAQAMVNIGTQAGRDVIATISDMNQPLGYGVGNALEVREALTLLHGDNAAPDLIAHCLDIAGHMLRLAGRGERWTDGDHVQGLLRDKLKSGAALSMFHRMVDAQGGDARYVDDPSMLPTATIKQEFIAPRTGYVTQVAADDIARITYTLGGGRSKKEDALDLSAGVMLHIKVGDHVTAGQPLFTVHANNHAKLDAAQPYIERAVTLQAELVEPLPHIHHTIYGSSVKHDDA